MDIDSSNLSSGEKSSSQKNPLEQFLVLSKGTKGADAVQLICQVLEAPGVYVFSELLDCENITDLGNVEEQKQYLDLLKLFAYGTYSDFMANEKSFPKLSEAMTKKLQHLTLVSLATGHKSLSLNDLGKQLGISSTRQLEDLIIEAIYAGIISGRLDQKNGILEVEFAIGRDIKMENLTQISNTLQEWCLNCDKMLENVDQLITLANMTKEEQTKHKLALDQDISSIKVSLKTQMQDNGEQMMVEQRDNDKKRLIKKPQRANQSKLFWQKNS